MHESLVEIGSVREHLNANRTRVLKFSAEMWHRGLREHKVLTAPTVDMLRTKAELQGQKWVDQWEKVEQKRRAGENRAASEQEAQRRTREAQERLREVETLLERTLSVDDTVNWESLKVHDKYAEAKPAAPKPRPKRDYPQEPKETWSPFVPRLNVIDRISSRSRGRKQKAAHDAFEAAVASWKKARFEIEENNAAIDRQNEDDIEAYRAAVVAWEGRRAEFQARQDGYNAGIDALRRAYSSHEQNAVEQYCEMVLNNSRYPDYFPKDFELLYNPETKVLLCEYYLPDPEQLPKLKEAKYVASTQEIRESYLPDALAEKNYDSMVYQVVLRTVHELFEADKADALDMASINGRVRFTNRATGREEETCIVSIQVRKAELVGIDLHKVDPRTCFRGLKGVGSSKLHSIAPVVPILQIDKTDRRFVEGRRVVDGLAESTNIAAMDWEEFEHLIRELFEKEFSQGGGEVKITQASRDGGVDAVAFDPGPIRGGKIVIQAKRYTNTVGVSAVRDLYGTVVNEGATKGILVTTADYGPDAYEFARNKPLTLLNGGNLLHLLEKHGRSVRIDLREAKKILGEKGAGS